MSQLPEPSAASVVFGKENPGQRGEFSNDVAAEQMVAMPDRTSSMRQPFMRSKVLRFDAR